MYIKKCIRNISRQCSRCHYYYKKGIKENSVHFCLAIGIRGYIRQEGLCREGSVWTGGERQTRVCRNDEHKACVFFGGSIWLGHVFWAIHNLCLLGAFRPLPFKAVIEILDYYLPYSLFFFVFYSFSAFGGLNWSSYMIVFSFLAYRLYFFLIFIVVSLEVTI